MKLLLINSLYTPNIVGGAERSVQYLAEALVDSGHDVAVACLTPQKTGHCEVINGVRVHYLPLRNLYWPFDSTNANPLAKIVWHGLDSGNLLMTRAINEVLEAERPDIVHTNNLTGFSALVWKTVKQNNRGLVHTLRDYSLLCPRTTMFRNGQNCQSQCSSCRLITRPRRSLSSLPDAVVGNSQFILDRHIENGYFEDVEIAAAVANIFTPLPWAGRSLAIESGPLKVGYLGQLTPTKGIKTLLEVVSQFSPGQITLDIGGKFDSPWAAALQTEYQSETIRFRGYVDPSKILRSIDLLVVPSLWHEPLPRTIFEAYGHGVPVLSSDTGGSPEIVEEGKTGLIYSASDPADLSMKLDYLIAHKDRISEYGSNAFGKASDFRPESIVAQYVEIYGQVLERNA